MDKCYNCERSDTDLIPFKTWTLFKVSYTYSIPEHRDEYLCFPCFHDHTEYMRDIAKDRL